MTRLTICCSALLLAASPLAAAEIPSDVASCTNFTTCSQAVRNRAADALRAAGRAGDVATIAKILDAMAKDGRVTPQTFILWSTAAAQFADLATNARRRGAPKELLAGFREGGATFGLWDDGSALGKTGDARVVEAIGAVLYRKMPQKGLSTDLALRRDVAYLERMSRAGSEADRQAAYARLEAQALACARPSTPAETNAVVEAYGGCLGFHAQRKLWADYAACARRLAEKTVLSGDWGPAALTARAMAAHALANDEAACRAYCADLAKLPLTSANFTAVKVYAATVIRDGWRNPETWEPVVPALEPYWKAPALPALDEVDRATALQFAQARQMALHDYAAAKDAHDKFAAFPAATRRAAVNAVYGWPFDATRRLAELAAEAGRHADADALLTSLYNGRDLRDGHSILSARYLSGNRAGAFEIAAQLATNGNAKAQDRFRIGLVVACLQAKDLADFSARVAGLRGTMADAEYFEALRVAERDLFLLDPTPSGLARIEAVERLAAALKRPEERLSYDLTHLADAPRSAGEALARNVFAKLKTENRLGRYAVYDTFAKEKELKMLKSAEAPHLAADVAGREACVAACYDASGVHLYLKFNDPDAWKVRDGLSEGPQIEHEIQPGGETASHWQMLSAAKPSADAGVEWDSPRKGYKIGSDYIRTDAVSADDCHVFHTFVPWVLCWREFPKDGDCWRYGLVASWAGQFGALGGGSVHELGRAMSLRFRIAPPVRERMKLALVRQAVADYRAVRGKFENAEFWADPHLGDGAFYAATVEPLLAELDAAAARVTVERPAAKDVEAVFADLFRFADFRLALDAERERFLTARLFDGDAGN